MQKHCGGVFTIITILLIEIVDIKKPRVFSPGFLKIVALVRFLSRGQGITFGRGDFLPFTATARPCQFILTAYRRCLTGFVQFVAHLNSFCINMPTS